MIGSRLRPLHARIGQTGVYRLFCSDQGHDGADDGGNPQRALTLFKNPRFAEREAKKFRFIDKFLYVDPYLFGGLFSYLAYHEALGRPLVEESWIMMSVSCISLLFSIRSYQGWRRDSYLYEYPRKIKILPNDRIQFTVKDKDGNLAETSFARDEVADGRRVGAEIRFSVPDPHRVTARRTYKLKDGSYDGRSGPLTEDEKQLFESTFLLNDKET